MRWITWITAFAFVAAAMYLSFAAGTRVNLEITVYMPPPDPAPEIVIGSGNATSYFSLAPGTYTVSTIVSIGKIDGVAVVTVSDRFMLVEQMPVFLLQEGVTIIIPDASPQEVPELTYERPAFTLRASFLQRAIHCPPFPSSTSFP